MSNERTLIGMSILGVLIAVGPARAQDANSGISLVPSQQVTRPQAPPTPTVEHLFGDWGGARTALADLGIDLGLDATSEFASNVSGGVKQGSTFANQLGFEADIDWGKLAGLTGLSTHTVLVNRSGSSDSQLFGDSLVPVQEIYGSGGDVAVHFVYTYAEQRLLGGSLDIAAGRMPLANDFAASPLYCNFMNNSLCGNPKALPGGDIGFSSYPDAVWGGRIRVRPRPDIYVQFGV
jgi:porin